MVCGAAIAAGLTSISIGSDIAGSIRVPSAFCGLFGHKPTFGLVPQQGHIPGPPGSLRDRDINTIGPLARDSRDLELVLAVTAGPVSQEALGWRLEPPPAPPLALKEYRVAAWLDDPFCPVDATLQDVFQKAVKELRGAGVAVEEAARPGFSLEQSHSVFPLLLRASLNAELKHSEWLELDERRQQLRAQWAESFTRYDILLAPVCSVPAFQHMQGPREERAFLVNGTQRPYQDFIVWPGLVGVSYLPSTALPAGLTTEGLPAGIQAVGPHLADRRTIRFAGLLGELMGGYRRPPGY